MHGRRVGSQVLTFGVSGKLWKNALVMFDRETGTLWSHLTGEGLYGPLEGERLRTLVSVPKITWQAWRAQHPDTRVLSIGGSEARTRDNYREYHRSGRTGLFKPQNRDRRLKLKDWVIGVRLGEAKKAYPMKAKHWKGSGEGKWKVVQDRLAEVPIVVTHNPDRFATGVWDLRVGEDEEVSGLTTVEGFFAVDGEGRTWNLLTGRGPGGLRLKPIPHMQVYWFAWTDFYPKSALYEWPE